MKSVLNLYTTWTAVNFLNYIEHSFSGTVVDWYDSLSEDGKNTLRTMETPAAKLNSSELKLILKKKHENGKEKSTI